MTHAVNHVGKPKVPSASHFTTITMRQNTALEKCYTYLDWQQGNISSTLREYMHNIKAHMTAKIILDYPVEKLFQRDFFSEIQNLIKNYIIVGISCYFNKIII